MSSESIVSVSRMLPFLQLRPGVLQSLSRFLIGDATEKAKAGQQLNVGNRRDP